MLDYPKTKELIYALNRLAVVINHQELKGRMEYWSLELLEDLAIKNNKKASEDVDVLISFCEFGKGVYEIEPINAEIVVEELKKLNAAIRQIKVLPDLPDIFAGFSGNNEENSLENQEIEGNSLNAAIRQSAILEKIRETANCQLKDLMAHFPEVSERTLRYDLQRLFSQNQIGRLGNGPNTCYVIKQ